MMFGFGKKKEPRHLDKIELNKYNVLYMDESNFFLDGPFGNFSIQKAMVVDVVKEKRNLVEAKVKIMGDYELGHLICDRITADIARTWILDRINR